MDEALYRRVLAALAATHAPSTAAHERAGAYAELEAFKKVIVLNKNRHLFLNLDLNEWTLTQARLALRHLIT
jgi:hypothetical protein